MCAAQAAVYDDSNKNYEENTNNIAIVQTEREGPIIERPQMWSIRQLMFMAVTVHIAAVYQGSNDKYEENTKIIANVQQNREG